MALIRGILDFINNRILILFFGVVICTVLAGCAENQEMNRYNDEQIDDTNLLTEMSENMNTVHEYYNIYNEESEEDRWYFYYDLFDLEGNIVKHECTYMDEPDIQMIDTDILKVSVQTGTGRSTKYSYYYDIKNDILSQTYYYVLGEKSNLVAYFSDCTISICEMFQEQVCYKQIDIPEGFRGFEEPVDSIIFSEDLNQVTVLYITGESDILSL